MIKMKKVFGMLLLALFLMGAGVLADSGVYDRGELFTSEETAELEAEAAKVAQEYDMNIILLTTADAEGMSSAAYAEDFYESGNYHQNDAKGGIVLLIDMEHRELNLVTYGDMIYYITDEREESIYDAGFDEVADGQYGDCMEEMLDAAEEYLEEGIPDDQYIYDEESGEIVYYQAPKSLDGTEILMAFVVAFLCALIPCLILWRRYSVVKDYDYSVQENADMNLRVREDHMIDMVVTHRRKPKPQSGGGSGSGGSRTTVHRSSGGSRVGGGHGRKF